jgi:replicative DNA helicase
MKQGISPDVSLAGSILIDPRCLDEVRRTITPEMFGDRRCRAIYEAACELSDEGATVDPVTIRSRAAEWDDAFSQQAMEITLTAANVGAYCEALHTEFLRRELLAGIQERADALLAGHDPLGEATELLTLTERIAEGSYDAGVVSAREAAAELLEDLDRVDEGYRAFVETGISDLDRILGGGLIREGLYILAARPGCGKTTLAAALAERMLERGRRILFISLEMSRKQLMARRVAADVGRATAAQILRGELSEEERKAVGESLVKLAKRPLFFNRRASLNTSEIQLLAKQNRADVVIIDYLGLMKHDAGKSLYERVTGTSNQLKRMARGLETPVLCLAQLNRGVEGRQSQEPRLSDLRDSGAIEQDADGVLLIHRPAIEDADEYGPTPMEVTVAKNRHGRTGKIELNWYMRSGRILEVRHRG